MEIETVKNAMLDILEMKDISSTGSSKSSELAARINTATTDVLQFINKYSKKKALQRIAASRFVREGVRRLHSTIDTVFQFAELDDAPEMNEWKEHEAADIEKQRVRLEEEIIKPSGAIVHGLSPAEVEEALLEIHLEINSNSNSDEFRELLKSAFEDPKVKAVKSVVVWELEDWFVRRDDIERAEGPFDFGSFGDVYKAKRGAEGADVCMKQLFVDVRDAQQRFLKETRIWHKLTHANVVTMLGACHVGSPLFFISELAKAGNFSDYLVKPENKSKLWQLFYQAAQGLAYLHSERVVHADIKCKNLVVDDDGVAKLCDFGFSYIQSLSNDESVAEQPEALQWKAPECLLAQGLAARPTFTSDVFSLGMSIIEAKTDDVPWGMKSEDEIMEAIRNSKSYPRPDGTFTDREWELVEGMTAFDPAKRWPLSRALDALKEFADNDSGAGSPDHHC